MARKPLTRQRSKWQPLDVHPALAAIGVSTAARRMVHDGALRVLVAEEPLGWHLSISFVDHRGAPTRYPTWDEIAGARDEFLPADVAFAMHLPVTAEYVALHDTTFHLHEHPERAAL